MYNFYFDESAHSRAITYKEGKGLNIHIQDNDKQNDLFVGCFIGMDVSKEFEIEQRFLMAESYIKNLLGLGNKELKGETIKTNKFRHGFNSVGKNNLKVYQTIFTLLDDNELVLHIHLLSKTEYFVREFFKNMEFPLEFDVNIEALIYSIVKFIFHYRKQELLMKMFNEDGEVSKLFLDELIIELQRIIEKAEHIPRMLYEVNNFREIIYCLSVAKLTLVPKEKYKWNYDPLFIGFSNLLEELEISADNVRLRIDPEGTNEIYEAANRRNFLSVQDDLDSHNSPLIRLADIVSNFFYKISYNLYDSLKEEEYKDVSSRDFETKRLLDEKWFDIKQEEVYKLYVQANKIFESRKDIYWTTFTGVYGDYALLTFSLLRYIGSEFENFDEYKSISSKQHIEYFNTYATGRLKVHFETLR